MNLKVRFKNPVSWAHLAVSFVTPILVHCGMNWEQITDWATLFNLIACAFQSPVVVVAIVVSVWNYLVDPTTRGVGDSPLAMTYTSPGICESKEDCNAETNSAD